jgi:hypothetical protein
MMGTVPSDIVPDVQEETEDNLQSQRHRGS